MRSITLIKLLTLIGLFYACSNPKETTLEGVNKQVNIEKQLTLGSTQIGLNTIISNLDVPWEIAWGPDNWIWYTEQKGQVSKVNPATGENKLMVKIPDVWHKRSTGLLGMALPPSFEKFPYVVVDYTYQKEDVAFSKLVRYTYTADTLINPVVLLEVSGAGGHNGSRVVIAPDGIVFWATGDAHLSEEAQNTNSLNGKVLRINIDGSIPDDNPIKGSAVWAWGYRNMQGLTYGSNGKLYTSEHGDVTDDEINLIRKGSNYGYPDVLGFCNTPAELEYCTTNTIQEPLTAWTPTIAPAGIDYYNSNAIPEWKNSLLLTTLRDTDLRVLKLNKAGDAIISEEIYLDKELGRLRDICISPSGDVYISTSNRDWNPAEGFPKENDDKIIRIFPVKDKTAFVKNEQAKIEPPVSLEEKKSSEGKIIYTNYCVSCHKVDGNGVPGVFPPLVGAEQVTGDKKTLINIVLNGLKGPVKVKGVEYDQEMPAFNFLSDKELAEVLSYIRGNFGNNSSRITIEDIANVRLKEKTNSN